VIFTSVVLLVSALEEVYDQTLREVAAEAQPVVSVVSITVMNSIKQLLSEIVKELPRLPATADIAEKPT